MSISDIFFDPGDQGELTSIYGDQLKESAFYDLLVAAKQKEIVSPNLSLTFGLPTVDGYDGGLLPLANYVLLERLFLPEGAVSLDGRLREALTAVPDGRWLDLFNTRYVITDKVGDVWADGVFYDLQHQARLRPRMPALETPYLPDYEATGVGVVYSGPAPPAASALLEIRVDFVNRRSETLTLRAGRDATALERVDEHGNSLWATRLQWSSPGIPVRLSLQAAGTDEVLVHGLSLVDERDDSFASLVISGSGRYRLVFSGDVKIYENLDVLPRAFLTGCATAAPDIEAALARMAATDFAPAEEVVLLGAEGAAQREGPAGQATVLDYQPELIRVAVEANDAGWLVVTDAYYPGWEARLDGEPVSILQADVLFRAVEVPAGNHVVEMRYRPGLARLGGWISFVALACSLLGLAAGWLRTRNARAAQGAER